MSKESINVISSEGSVDSVDASSAESIGSLHI
jgi:hypothetical protein